MKPSEHYVGQRVSLKGQSCTVRYVGSVANKPGTWLGVEWDDTSRGKHNGTHDDVKYFECRSKSATAASFLRPYQPWDPPRVFLQALREKYMPEFHESDAEIVYFSGKQAEEIGFEKFHQRQAKLQGIRVLVLDHMQIQHRRPAPEEVQAIIEICADITELDLSGNLFETFDEILYLCKLLPKLRVLTLDGNRFAVDPERQYASLPSVHTLNLGKTLLSGPEINCLISDSAPAFPKLTTLNLAGSEYSQLDLRSRLKITFVDLSDNEFDAISSIQGLLFNVPHIQTLILKRNRIQSVEKPRSAMGDFYTQITELDLSHNNIFTFAFFLDMNTKSFPDLKHLRVTGNPLYKSLVSAEGKPLAAEDGYMLTIARLPQLEYLNYSKITEKERLNAETFYLGQIAAEMAREGKAAVLSRHPRYEALCEEYGEPTVERKVAQDEVNPNSLAAKLVAVTFTLAKELLPEVEWRSWTEEVPKSLNIYAVLGMVGKRLGVMPLELRLILETNERDPVGRDSAYAGPEWWDSSDEESEAKEEEWVKRRVELVAGTRALGTFVETCGATVRVEMRRGDV